MLARRLWNPAKLSQCLPNSLPIWSCKANLFIRHYAKKAGAKGLKGTKAAKDVNKEVLREMNTVELTLKLTDDEKNLPVEELTFEQLYRRILFMWEEGSTDPKKVWMLDLVKKAHTSEEWDQMLIICRIFQHKMFLFNPHQASYFIMLACANGNQEKILKLFSEESPRLFCNKSGYIHLMKTFLDKNDFHSAWKVLDLVTKRNVPLNRAMFKIFIEAYVREGRLDDALRTISVERKMQLKVDPLTLSELISSLYKAERYADILSLAAIVKEDGMSFLPPDLPYIIGTHIQLKDDLGVVEIIKGADKEALHTALQTLINNAQTDETKAWLNSVSERVDQSAP